MFGRCYNIKGKSLVATDHHCWYNPDGSFKNIASQLGVWIGYSLGRYVCNNFIPPFVEEYT